jgi:uncharacterized protein (TIGR00730 family)
MAELHNIAVYCGSSAGTDPAWAGSARALGRELATRGIGLVYGGGNMGIMGELARAVMGGGGRAIGVIPQKLNALVDHVDLTALEVTPGMHERKARMMELADAFVILPGGIGTMEEFFEVLTWQQLGYHAKPVGLLDSAGWFRPLVALLDHLESTGFLKPAHRRSVLVHAEPAPLMDALAAQSVVTPPKLPERQ